MGKIVICGDSFAIGIGCRDLKKDPFGQLLGDKLKRDVVNFAKGSSTNYSITLQVEYVLENIDDIDLLIISQTCEHRVNFFKEKEQLQRAVPFNKEITNLDVNYHEYPPYGEGTYQEILPHPYKDHPDYTGVLNTENFYGPLSYLEKYKELKDLAYFEKFSGEEYRKLELIKNYYNELWDGTIQHKYDVAILFYCHTLAKRKGVEHLLAGDWPEFEELVDNKNYCKLSWGDLSLKYPDEVNTGHTSELGHIEAYEIVLSKLKMEGLY